jgi:hypothetical protein
MLDCDARFCDAVEMGRDAARRGDLIDHDDVVSRIEQLLKS